VNYRRYADEDFAQLYAIEEVCFQPPFRFGRAYMRHLVNSLNAATWIAEEDGRMAGFAIVEWTRERGGLIGYIQTIEVAMERRGQGVGGELMRRMEKSAREAGARAIGLHVDETNGDAIRLYEAHGYVCEGRSEDHYAKGRAGLMYAKALDGGPEEVSYTTFVSP
jgi:[ribosomal protein S18]-alanine N-acetyltransferase